MTAYLVADLDIRDAEGIRAYAQEVPALIARYGGRYLVRGGPLRLLEGDWKPRFLVVLEFPTMDALDRFYRSEEYRPYLELRRRAAPSDVIAIEGA